MSTISNDVVKTSYTQISNGEVSGSVYHFSGGNVAYTQATSQPGIDAPVMNITKPGDDFVYWKMPAGVVLWARSLTTSAKVTTSAAED